jgi:hypothetical protein
MRDRAWLRRLASVFFVRVSKRNVCRIRLEPRSAVHGSIFWKLHVDASAVLRYQEPCATCRSEQMKSQRDWDHVFTPTQTCRDAQSMKPRQRSPKDPRACSGIIPGRSPRLPGIIPDRSPARFGDFRGSRRVSPLNAGITRENEI